MGVAAFVVTGANQMSDVWLPPVVPTIETDTPDDRAAKDAAFGPTWWSPEIAALNTPLPEILRGARMPKFPNAPFNIARR
jgi:hypothetical protein